MDRPKRDWLIKARCGDREHELIRAAARAERISISELVRTAAIAEAKRVLVRGEAPA
jgi:uncharacterized protein (DUF1778 family)